LYYTEAAGKKAGKKKGGSFQTVSAMFRVSFYSVNYVYMCYKNTYISYIHSPATLLAIS